METLAIFLDARAIFMKKTPKNNTLAAWLADERLPEYLGRAATLRLEVLAWVVSPGNRTLGSIAKANNVARQQLSRYARAASRIFGVENARQRKARGNSAVV